MVQKTSESLSSEGHLCEFAQGSFGTEELAGGKYCATTTHCSEGFGTKLPNHCHSMIVCAIHWLDLAPKNNVPGDESRRKQRLAVHGNFPGGTAGSTCTSDNGKMCALDSGTRGTPLCRSQLFSKSFQWQPSILSPDAASIGSHCGDHCCQVRFYHAFGQKKVSSQGARSESTRTEACEQHVQSIAKPCGLAKYPRVHCRPGPKAYHAAEPASIPL